VLTLTTRARATPQDSLQAATGLRYLAQPRKCVFRAAEVTFLGYRISGKDSNPLPVRVAGLEICAQTHKTHHLQWFLGMLKLYRRFLPHTAATQAPLHALLACPRTKASMPVNWTTSPKPAHGGCKTSLSHAALFACPEGAAPIALVTDAPTAAMGAVLQTTSSKHLAATSILLEDVYGGTEI